jgi:hypothetical protein
MHLIRDSLGLCMNPQRTVVGAPAMGFCSGVTFAMGLVSRSNL